MSEQKTENQTENKETPAAPAAEAPATPKLAAGLFQPFTLGSTLEQASHGNVMSNTKKNMMDYEKQYQGSTKNQQLSPEELAKLEVKKAKVQISGPSRKIGVTPKAVAAAYGTPAPAKKSVSADEIIESVPADQRELIMAELDRRIEEAKKSNNEAEVQKLEKAKDKAKKCYGPQMDRKQPKAEDLK